MSAHSVKRQRPIIDRLKFEREAHRHGCGRVAGVDEAGRGPLAGPVVAAAVILPREWVENGLPDALSGLNDSKQLTGSQRDRFFDLLLSSAGLRHGLGVAEAAEIDRWNILQATYRAMHLALAALDPSPDHVLVDGHPVRSLTFRQTALVKGDSRSASIAAASVLAKVTRDRLMLEHHRQWPHYGFDEHKGYGTPQHLAALAAHGPCPIHRRTFEPLRPREQDLW